MWKAGCDSSLQLEMLSLRCFQASLRERRVKGAAVKNIQKQ